MNNMLQLLQDHVSIRSFTNQPLTEEQRDAVSDHIEDHLERCKHPFILSYLNKQGFAKNKPLVS